MCLTPERAVWWPGGADGGALMIADTHWGKSETLRRMGAGVPGGVLAEQLDRLGRLIARFGAERVIVVGDLLHAGIGITPSLVDRVGEWVAASGVVLEVVPGNHDRAIERVIEPWNLVMRDAVHREGAFTFVHDPADVPGSGLADGYAWCGHVHPGVRLAGGGDAVRVPCYVMGERVGVLPACSSFTGRGGGRVGDDAAVFAIAGERVLQV